MNPLLLSAGKPHVWSLSGSEIYKKPHRLGTKAPFMETPVFNTSAPKSSCHRWKRRFKVSKLLQHFWKHYALNLLPAGQTPKARHAICKLSSKQFLSALYWRVSHRLTRASFGAVKGSLYYDHAQCSTGGRHQWDNRIPFFFLKYFSSGLQKAAPLQSNGKKKSVLLILRTADKAYLSWS